MLHKRNINRLCKRRLKETRKLIVKQQKTKKPKKEKRSIMLKAGSEHFPTLEAGNPLFTEGDEQLINKIFIRLNLPSHILVDKNKALKILIYIFFIFTIAKKKEKKKFIEYFYFQQKFSSENENLKYC